MMKRYTRYGAIPVKGAAFALLACSMNPALAADHQEAPTASSRLAADIGDYYAWHADGNLNVIVTFGTFAESGAMPAYDPTLLYSMHFDLTDDGISDLNMHARFAQDDNGNWGLQVMGPANEVLEGAVETVLGDDTLRAWAGQADDPFFFDLAGYTETINSGTLSFDPSRDSVAGLNVTAIAIQLPLSAISDTAAFETWATTGTL